MTKIIFILLLSLCSTIAIGQDSKAIAFNKMYHDSTWRKNNLFNATVEFISIEKYPLQCGYINEWTTAKLKIISTDNNIVNIGQTYDFYIICNTFKDKPTKGHKFIVEGIIKFADNDSETNKMNSFKGDDPNRIMTWNLKKTK
jgi:hypothetical protein